MDDVKIVEVPKEEKVDYARKLLKGGFSAIPIAGGLIGELVDMVFVPRYQKRMQEWCESVNTTLESLLASGTTKEKIFESEEFISLFSRTTKIYMENIEEYKKPLLQSALRAAVTREVPLDKKYIFLNVIDKLTETQLMILRDVTDNAKLYETGSQQYQTALELQLAEKYANDDQGYLQLLISGLKEFHLLSYSSAGVLVSGSVQWHMVPSRIGNEFMEYLTAK